MALILKPEDFPQPDSRLALTVSYGEVDQMGYAYYGHYPHWFARGRGHFIRVRGMSYGEVEARGVWLPVRDMAVRYLRPARYDDAITVRTAVSEWGRASVTFAYQIFGPPEDATLLAVGETLHACTSPQGRPMPVPSWLRELFTV